MNHNRQEDLSAGLLKQYQKAVWAGSQLVYYEETDSTNTQARYLAQEGAKHGTLVVAEQQTVGRGRRGRNWQAAAGENIAMSLVLKPEIDPNHASMLTLVTALAVVAALKKVTGLDAGIKWPNDIVLNGKKLCGILTEMGMQGTQMDFVIVGIGINVHTREFPEELAPTATSLYLETRQSVCRAELAAEIWAAFEQYYAIYLQTEDLGSLVEEYNAHLVNLHRSVRVLDPTEPFYGTAMGITPQGELIVDTEGTRHLVASGEVSVRGIYGYV